MLQPRGDMLLRLGIKLMLRLAYNVDGRATIQVSVYGELHEPFAMIQLRSF